MAVPRANPTTFTATWIENNDFHRRLFTSFEGHRELVERTDDVQVTIRFEFETRYGRPGKLISAYLGRAAPLIVDGIFDGWEAEVECRLEGASTVKEA